MKRQIIDKIEQYDTIIIHRHVRPDPDAYGSQFGLKTLLQINYPNKKIYAVGEHDPSLDFLAHPEEIDDALYNGALVIVTDTANTERISDQRYNQGDFLIKIDHHPNEDVYGDLLWVNTEASSVSEMIYTFYEEGRVYKNWTITEDVARFIFTGIIGDTGRFRFSSTTPKTFETAARLIATGFDRDQIFNGLYELDFNVLKMQGYFYQHVQMYENGAASLKITKEILEEYGVTSSETSLLIGSLGNVKGIRAWVIFVEEDDKIRVRLRSKAPIINELAKKYGGGGHPLASGATVYSWDEADRLIEDLRQYCHR